MWLTRTLAKSPRIASLLKNQLLFHFYFRVDSSTRPAGPQKYSLCKSCLAKQRHQMLEFPSRLEATNEEQNVWKC